MQLTHRPWLLLRLLLAFADLLQELEQYKSQLQDRANTIINLTDKLQKESMLSRGLSSKLGNTSSELQTLLADHNTLQDNFRVKEREVIRLIQRAEDLEDTVEKLEKIGQDLMTYRGEWLLHGVNP
jgi:predicted nuclease with TOPRIM domain